MRILPRPLMLMSLAMIFGTQAAKASSYLIQLDDLTENPVAYVYQDGALVQTSPLTESPPFVETFVTNGGTLSSNVNVAYNIFDTNGVTLSDTFTLSGAVGDTQLFGSFSSDVEGGPALIPLVDALSLTETGDWQTLVTYASLDGTGAPLDTFTIQFRSDVETPLPGAIWLFGSALAGVVGVGKWRRKRMNAAALAAA